MEFFKDERGVSPRSILTLNRRLLGGAFFDDFPANEGVAHHLRAESPCLDQAEVIVAFVRFTMRNAGSRLTDALFFSDRVTRSTRPHGRQLVRWRAQVPRPLGSELKPTTGPSPSGETQRGDGRPRCAGPP